MTWHRLGGLFFVLAGAVVLYYRTPLAQFRTDVGHELRDSVPLTRRIPRYPSKIQRGIVNAIGVILILGGIWILMGWAKDPQ
jgi:hypothetical protein